MKYLLLLLLSYNLFAIVPFSPGETISANSINSNFNFLDSRVDRLDHLYVARGRRLFTTTSDSYVAVTDRELIFNKKENSTSISMVYGDSLRTLTDGKMCALKVVVEDLNGNYVCSNTPIEHNRFNIDIITPSSFWGYCQGISSGTYKIKVYLKDGSPQGGYTGGNCELSWEGKNDWYIRAQEVYIN